MLVVEVQTPPLDRLLRGPPQELARGIAKELGYVYLFRPLPARLGSASTRTGPVIVARSSSKSLPKNSSKSPPPPHGERLPPPLTSATCISHRFSVLGASPGTTRLTLTTASPTPQTSHSLVATLFLFSKILNYFFFCLAFKDA